MKHFSAHGVLQLAAAVVVIWLAAAGCQPALREGPVSPIEPTLGKQNINEAIAALDAHRERIKPIRAGGNCLVEWYESNGTKHKENPAIQVRLVPPDLLFFMGEILGNEVVRFGTNSREFWLRAKPKEINSYWWGRRETAQRCRGGGFLNPESVLEAMGIVHVDTRWTFVGWGGFDILTLRDEEGRPVKSVHVDWRDYLVKKIEYFDVSGQARMTARMSGYGDNTGGIPVPTQIDILFLNSADGSLSINMTLRDVRLFEPTEEQLAGKLFARPDTEGFENVYILADNCEFVRVE
jgi:hypothetical protein